MVMISRPTFFLARRIKWVGERLGRFGLVLLLPAAGLAALAGVFEVFGTVGTLKLIYILRKARKEENDRRNQDAQV